MGLTKCESDLDVIAKLPDTPMSPEYDAARLKEEFDKAPNMLKEYINSTLIPEIDEAIASSGGGGAATFRKLLVTFTTAGLNSFVPTSYPSEGNLYDIVLIGGGGGGCSDSAGTLTSGVGGGSGAVKCVEGYEMTSSHIMYVGAAGESGTGSGSGGGMTYFFKRGSAYEHYANGGAGANSASNVSFSGGIGGTDSYPSNVSEGFYGAGGDNAYGRGARGGATADDTRAASGYGAGGWGTLQPTGGAIMVYGYVKG